MNMVIYGICAHIGQLGRDPHRVALPAGGDQYEVPDDDGRLIKVPDHVALLSIRKRDVASDKPDEAIRKFEGDGLTADVEDPDTKRWRLAGVTLSFRNINDAFDPEGLACVPRRSGSKSVTVDSDVEKGTHKPSVAAYLDIAGGRLVAIVEEDKDGKQGGRHTRLTAEPAGNWELTVRYRGGAERSLPLVPGAVLALSNHEASACDPCSDDDYLHHYRLTTPNFVKRNEFKAPDCKPTEGFDPRDFPLPGGITSTLLSCSNSTYP
jgi:hypothetical protein